MPHHSETASSPQAFREAFETTIPRAPLWRPAERMTRRLSKELLRVTVATHPEVTEQAGMCFIYRTDERDGVEELRIATGKILADESYPDWIDWERILDHTVDPEAEVHLGTDGRQVILARDPQTLLAGGTLYQAAPREMFPAGWVSGHRFTVNTILQEMIDYVPLTIGEPAEVRPLDI